MQVGTPAPLPPDEFPLESLAPSSPQDDLDADLRGVLLFLLISLGALGFGAFLARISRSGLPSNPSLRERLQVPLEEVEASASEAPSPLPIESSAPQIEPPPPKESLENKGPPSLRELMRFPLDPLLFPEIPGAIERKRQKLGEFLEAELPRALQVPRAEIPFHLRAETLQLPRWVSFSQVERILTRIAPKSPVPFQTKRLERPGKPEQIGLTFLVESKPQRLVLEKPAPFATIAFVIDDVGYGGASTRSLLELRSPLTLAVLPFYRASKDVSERAQELGFDTILHMPMKPKGAIGKYRPKVILHPRLKADEIRSRLVRALEEVPHAIGVNNHMGSEATESWFLMGEILPVLSSRGLFFLDSLTSPRSVAHQAARHFGLPSARRTTNFLDNEATVPGVRKAFEALRKNTQAGSHHVAILHDKAESVQVLKEAWPRFRKAGIEWNYLTDHLTP